MRYYLTLLFSVFLLSACASSDMERGAASEADDAYIQSKETINSFGESSVANAYENTSQTSKSVFAGATLGGSMISSAAGVGFIPGLAGGAIIGGAFGAYIDAHTTLMDKLKNRGVKVIVLGDQVLLVMMSDHTFQRYTPRLRPESYSTLDLIAELINGNPNMSVKIAAYATMAGPKAINQALTQQQAEQVEKYLWRRNVNTRMLYAVGYGDANRVTKDDTSSSDNPNYRIEITFEKEA